MPHRNDPAVKPMKPHITTNLMRPLSLILPKTRMRPAITRKYVVTIQDASPALIENERAISGRATVTIVPSNPSRNMPMAITPNNNS